MIIRSQDKKTTSDDMNLHIQEREMGKYTFFNIRNSKDVCLGSYKTKEKAIKVLDMICKEYKHSNNSTSLGHYGFVENRVFQMPSEKEVEV